MMLPGSARGCVRKSERKFWLRRWIYTGLMRFWIWCEEGFELEDREMLLDKRVGNGGNSIFK